MATLMRIATAAVAEGWTHVLGERSPDCDENHRLASDVRRALQTAGYPALNRASVLISDGCVVLRGRVPSFHVKQIAQEIAMQVVHVLGVINLLEVDGDYEPWSKERSTETHLEAR